MRALATVKVNPDTERTPKNISEEVHNALEQLGFTHYSVISDIPMILHSTQYVKTYSNEVNSLVIMDMHLSKTFLKQSRAKYTERHLELKYRFRNTAIARKCVRVYAKIVLLRAKEYKYSKQDMYIYSLLSALQLSRRFSVNNAEIFQGDVTVSAMPILMITSRKTEKLLKKCKIQTNEMFANCKLKKVIFNGRGKLHLKQPKNASCEIENFLDSIKILNR